MKSSQITVYSTTWCAFCKAAMDYFDKLGLKYTDEDVETNLKAGLEAVEKSGQRGVPVIDIDGNIIVGFDKQKIDSALKSAKLI